jgi:uncharacterized protein YdhG (YjbR/CyaY superfamily)
MTVKIKNVDDYIAAQPQEIREKLEVIRSTILKTAPKAEEKISYGMPGYKLNGMLACFAAFKNHHSVFFMPYVLREFASELKGYKTSKSAIQIPNDKKIPQKLLKDIIKAGIKFNFEKAQAKQKKNEEDRRNRKTAAKRAPGK